MQAASFQSPPTGADFPPGTMSSPRPDPGSPGSQENQQDDGTGSQTGVSLSDTLSVPVAAALERNSWTPTATEDAT